MRGLTLSKNYGPIAISYGQRATWQRTNQTWRHISTATGLIPACIYRFDNSTLIYSFSFIDRGAAYRSSHQGYRYSIDPYLGPEVPDIYFRQDHKRFTAAHGKRLDVASVVCNSGADRMTQS
jgi:hypothetical protein